jgi:hypothetical protein
MTVNKFHNLRMESPVEIAPHSNKKLTWICDCGNKCNRIVQDVISGRSKSCGECTSISIDEVSNKKFGHLRIKYPEIIKRGSHRKILWVCDCGEEKFIDICSVIKGLSKSCGHCNEISIDKIKTMKFGRLKLKTPNIIRPGSGKKETWTCDCGNETIAIVAHVLSGHTKSCGKCLLSMKINYDISKHDIRSLRTPILPEQLPKWCPIALESICNVNIPFKARCRLCNREYYPRWYSIRLGNSLTCGCTTSRISSGQQEIFQFIRSLGVDAKLEHSIRRLKYDIFIPGHNLTIEYTGLKWHSYRNSRYRDVTKYLNAINHNMRHIMIYEDEWTDKRFVIENLLRSILGKQSCVTLRPNQCVIDTIDHKTINSFYDQYHYIGSCRAKHNFGVLYNNKLVACMSFACPTRQSLYQWEIVRMVSHPDYRVHGIWSKLLKLFIETHSPKSIISFSDNRLFTGNTYEKIGFKLDKEIKQDYYWWKNKRRFHKSTLRKHGENITEDQLRMSQGFAKIWDLGKKRWLLTLP